MRAPGTTLILVAASLSITSCRTVPSVRPDPTGAVAADGDEAASLAAEDFASQSAMPELGLAMKSPGLASWQPWGAAAGAVSLILAVTFLARRRRGVGHAPASPARRGRRFALATLSVGALLLAATCLLGREGIREQWLLYRLESPDPEGRLDALDRLVELQSRRAAPRLVEIVRKEAAITELGSRAALALLVLSPEDSLRLYRENGRFWHLQLAMGCGDWTSQFLIAMLERALASRELPERYSAWALGLFKKPDHRGIDFAQFQPAR